MRHKKLKEFHKACQNIIDNRDAKALNYVVNYAKHGLTITELYEAKVQALYILGNMTSWRGEVAKETRAILKKLTK